MLDFSSAKTVISFLLIISSHYCSWLTCMLFKRLILETNDKTSQESPAKFSCLLAKMIKTRKPLKKDSSWTAQLLQSEMFFLHYWWKDVNVWNYEMKQAVWANPRADFALCWSCMTTCHRCRPPFTLSPPAKWATIWFPLPRVVHNACLSSLFSVSYCKRKKKRRHTVLLWLTL